MRLGKLVWDGKVVASSCTMTVTDKIESEDDPLVAVIMEELKKPGWVVRLQDIESCRIEGQRRTLLHFVLLSESFFFKK